MHKARIRLRRFSLVAMLMVVTCLWLAAPVVHTYVDHIGHHASGGHDKASGGHGKQACVICMQLSVPYMGGSTVVFGMLYAMVLCPLFFFKRVFPHTSSPVVRSPRAPPVW